MSRVIDIYSLGLDSDVETPYLGTLTIMRQKLKRLTIHIFHHPVKYILQESILYYVFPKISSRSVPIILGGEKIGN